MPKTSQGHKRKNYNIGGKKSGTGLRKWFSRNKGKGWVNCKTGAPCGRKSRKVVGLTPPVDQQWRNAKVSKVKLQPEKRLHQSE